MHNSANRPETVVSAVASQPAWGPSGALSCWLPTTVPKLSTGVTVTRVRPLKVGLHSSSTMQLWVQEEMGLDLNGWMGDLSPVFQ